jgi:hypothetical protein
MAASKSATAFTWASGSSTSSGTTNPIDCSTDYAQQVYVSVAVVGSPSAGAAFYIAASPDGGTTYYSLPTYTASTTAGTYYWVIDVPVTATKVEIVYTAQTGGTSSTLVAQLGQVTGI